MKIENKVIWLTGASSGIGRELAFQMAGAGARLILSARNESALNQLAQELDGGLEKHWVFPMDLSEPEKLMEKAKLFAEQFERIDMVVNNGGISQRASCLESDLNVYRQLIEVNYLGTVALTKVVLPIMVKQQSGMVVSISSVAGKIGSKLRTGYSGSKFAVVGFMDCLRAEVKDKGIHCLTICPGSIQTNLAMNALNGEGNAQNKNDPSIENGMDVISCCHKIIQAIEKEKDEVVIGQGISSLAPTIKRFFPSLFNTLTARAEYR